MEFKVVNNVLKRIGEWSAGMTVDQALDLSIEKWETIVKHIEEHGITVECGGRHTCALCGMFWLPMCEGCPIHAETGQHGCVSTPYDDYDSWCGSDSDENLEHAKAELKFLKGLREARKADSPTVSPQVEG